MHNRADVNVATDVTVTRPHLIDEAAEDRQVSRRVGSKNVACCIDSCD